MKPVFHIDKQDSLRTWDIKIVLGVAFFLATFAVFLALLTALGHFGILEDEFVHEVLSRLP